MAQTNRLICKHWSKNFLFDFRKLTMSTAVNAMKKDDSKSDSTLQEEVKKFTQLSKHWWDLNGHSKALHAMNAVRVPFIRDGLVQCPHDKRNPTPLKNMVILDVGCGGGILSEALAKIGADVTGIDPTPNLIEIAQRHCQENTRLIKKPKYECTTIEEHLNNHKEYYDGVVASEVIEHVADKELFVKSCISTLKPGGRIFFTTPNRTRMTQILGIYVAEYVINVVPKGTHQYDMLITPNELSFLLERNNCHVDVVYGLFYNFLQNKWSFVKSPSLMYAIQAQKIK